MTTNNQTLKFDLVSTWGEACGIFEYANALLTNTKLTDGLQNVFARRVAHSNLHSEDKTHLRTSIHRCWTNESHDLNELGDRILQSSSSGLWFQYHPSFFNQNALQELASIIMRAKYSQRVLTVHNPDGLDESSFAKYFTDVVVHNEQTLNKVGDLGSARSHIIPHFVYSRDTFCRKDLSPEFTIATVGFAAESKRVPLLIEAFSISHELFPEMRLHILTSPFPTHSSHFELSRIASAIKHSEARDAIKADLRPKSLGGLLSALSQAHLLCIPYAHSSESASGAARLGLSAGVPILRSSSPIFSDLPGGDIVLNGHQAEWIAEAMLMLSQTPSLLGAKRAEIDEIYNKQEVTQIAARFAELLI